MLLLLLALAARPAFASDAPAWMHALTSAPLPPHDEKTDAVLLYSEEILIVQPNGKLKEIDRNAYRILRPGGRHFGKVTLTFETLRSEALPRGASRDLILKVAGEYGRDVEEVQLQRR